MLAEDSDLDAVQMVLARYGDPLTEDDMITIGQDPFLIAAAVGNANRCVVTAEVSKPTRTGARRHVPDVCSDCGVNWISPVGFIAELDFSTAWDSIEKAATPYWTDSSELPASTRWKEPSDALL